MLKAELYIVECRDGVRMSIGQRQAEFLLARDWIRKLPSPFLYVTDYSLHELNGIVLSFAELRECDFCTAVAVPAPWRILCAAFRLTRGTNAGMLLGGPERPIFCCDGCHRHLGQRDRQRLTEHAVGEHVDRAFAGGVMQPGVSKRRARDHIRSGVREVVHGVIDNMHDTGVRDD